MSAPESTSVDASSLAPVAPTESAVRGTFRAVLVDAQPMFRAGVRLALEAAGHSVLGEASSIDEASQLFDRQPNLVVIHAESVLGDVLGTLRDLAAAGHALRVLVIAPDGAPEETAEAVRLGVVGVLPPTIDADLLRRCLQVVSAGEFWIRRESVAPLLRAMRETPTAAPRPYGLTQRELEVVLAVVEGLSNREIAAKLMIREDTVKHHLSAAFDKTGTFSRVELAVFAMNHRIGAARRITA